MDEMNANSRALNLYAALLDADSFTVASHHLVATLASTLNFDRVSLALVDGPRTHLVATSDGPLPASGSDLAQRLLGALDEALEQGLVLTFPDTRPEGMPITVGHRLLHQHVGGALVTVPLGQDGKRFAAVCAERRSASTISVAEAEQLSQLLVLAVPALRWMQEAEASTWVRLKRQLHNHWRDLQQPEKRNARRLRAAIALAVVVVCVVPFEDHVSGRARIEGAQQRTITAPNDGFIKTSYARAGDSVKAGDPLIDLLDADLRLEQERLNNQLSQHENALAAALAGYERVGAATSGAKVEEVRAQLALVESQLGRGRISAPFDALVVQGDLSQSIGAAVRQGDALLVLATSGRQRIIVEVDEIDIARIEVGQKGQLALSSIPWSDQELVVERIALLAKAVDGRNIFEVEARLLNTSAAMRPGGRAQLASGRAPLAWSWLRHTMMRLRVQIWAWLG